MKKILTIFLLSFLISCTQETPNIPTINQEDPLELIAEHDKLWTGLTISNEGRIFVNFPRWSKDVPISVGEIVDGKVQPYPNKDWNSWTQDLPIGNSFVCVQSVFIDDQNFLWILDPSNPYFEGVIDLEAKLYKVDLQSDEIIETYTYDTTVIHPNSYLNDVRIDTKNKVAYITDSGVGGILVTNLETGETNRLLEDHHSVQAHFDHLVIGEDKIPFEVDSDGIALKNNRNYLYYAPLSAHNLYRIKTEYLRSGQASAEHVEIVQVLDVATDGMLFDKHDNLFMGGLENNSVNVYTNQDELIQLIQDPRIKWADSFTKDNQGNIYFTTSQLHLPANERVSYRIYKLNLTDKN